MVPERLSSNRPSNESERNMRASDSVSAHHIKAHINILAHLKKLECSDFSSLNLFYTHYTQTNMFQAYNCFTFDNCCLQLKNLKKNLKM